MIMTPTHADSPLRRSEVGALRTPVQTPVINDDDEERRQARRRTVLEDSSTSSTIEDNEALKNCLKIYQENKLSRENAWSVSLIDTLSHLLDKHHKSLNNFKVAGSSLEASSKVYGLRVDSIHIDVIRLSSGLNKQKFVEQPPEKEVNNAEDNPEEAENAAGKDPAEDPAQPKRKKRNRKHVSTITKNKETINAKLDTNPFTDAIFAKLNSVMGSFNSSNRLLQNILPSLDSELRLRMDYPFWDSSDKPPLTYTEEHDYSNFKTIDATLFENLNTEGLVLRPNHTGYIISDTPAEQESDNCLPPSPEKDLSSQMAVAFDINADVEPVQADSDVFMDVDMGQLDDLTVEDHVAIHNCKGLRRQAVTLDDMRPIDSTSATLEYSYRPLDKISQFWAGPSHWKFKKSRSKSLSIGQRFSSLNEQNQKQQNQKARRKHIKFRSQYVPFGQIHDELFQKLDSKTKMRKANIQKTWDYKKLKLPTDLQIDKNIFDNYRYAPGLHVNNDVEAVISPDLPTQTSYDYANPVDQEYCSNIPNDDYIDSEPNVPEEAGTQDSNVQSQTIVEIATEFAGAPDKVMKIIVPFAKRAKVVDMKQMKKRCLQEIQNEFIKTEKENLPGPSPQLKYDKYKPGIASFSNIYKQLPSVLTPNMVEALSPSVAFYSILHLANDTGLRLIQQEDLKDFKIRQLDD